MKNYSLALLSTFFIISIYAFTLTKKTEVVTQKAQVMVLGSYHMNNPGADVYNMEADDVLTPKRQAEIKDLAAALAKFKPTKIALERSYGGRIDSLKQAHYQQYLVGKYNLTRNEDEQVGFRLAKMMGHSQVYCVDNNDVGFDFGTMMDYATEHDQLSALENGRKFAEALMKKSEEDLRSMTIRQYFKNMNQPESIKQSHGFYMDFCKVGKGNDFPGADLVADWYKRNIRIFSNINKITTSKEDRILVIFGAGHAPILRELIEYANDYELVEAVDYL